MRRRKILITKSFEKELKNWRTYKIQSENDLRHYTSKLRAITKRIIGISRLKEYPYKKVTFRRSKQVQFFIYQQHAVFFRMTPQTMKLLYFVPAKRIKTKF